jgi:hypothetical protein
MPVSVEVVPEMDTLGKCLPAKTLGKGVISPPAKPSSPCVMESELAMGIPAPASSPTSSASLTSPISSSRSPASQPSSLAFAGSSVELGSLSVSLSQMPSPEPSGLIDAQVLPIPELQPLVNGLTETQTWYLGWLRESTRCHEVLAAIDRIEVQTRRKNEVAPPQVCSTEIPQLKAKLAGVRAANRETVVQIMVLSGCKPCPQ